MGGEVVPVEIKRDRALRGRQSVAQRLEQSRGLQYPPGAKGREINNLPAVREGLKVLDPSDKTFEERREVFQNTRTKYAAMHAHKEMAAMVLAAGGTFGIAATKAGVSRRQVKKYYAEPDFRSRIEELRNIMFSKVRGRVIREMEKRTEPGKIDKIELLDLLRVFDRVAGPIGGKAGVNIAGDVNVSTTNHDTLIQALLTPEPSSEEPDFPSYELNGSSVSDSDPF